MTATVIHLLSSSHNNISLSRRWRADLERLDLVGFIDTHFSCRYVITRFRGHHVVTLMLLKLISLKKFFKILSTVIPVTRLYQDMVEGTKTDTLISSNERKLLVWNFKRNS